MSFSREFVPLYMLKYKGFFFDMTHILHAIVNITHIILDYFTKSTEVLWNFCEFPIFKWSEYLYIDWYFYS